MIDFISVSGNIANKDPKKGTNLKYSRKRVKGRNIECSTSNKEPSVTGNRNDDSNLSLIHI